MKRSLKRSIQSSISTFALLSAGLPGILAGDACAQNVPSGIANIETIVVIYAENRSFDNLYGYFPGANGLQHVTRPIRLSATATARC